MTANELDEFKKRLDASLEQVAKTPVAVLRKQRKQDKRFARALKCLQNLATPIKAN